MVSGFIYQQMGRLTYNHHVINWNKNIRIISKPLDPVSENFYAQDIDGNLLLIETSNIEVKILGQYEPFIISYQLGNR